MKYLLLSVLFYGCCCPKEVTTERETLVRIDTVQVKLPAEVQFDTVFVRNGEGESVKYIVRVDTVTQRVCVKGKERIVQVAQIDTVFREKVTVKVSESWYSNLWAKVGGVLLIVLLIIIAIKWRVR